VAISGTTTITSFGTGVNRRRYVRAAGDFKIVHNGTTLALPGGKNIAAKSGDTFVVASDSSGNAMVYLYQRGSAPPPALPIGTVVPFAGASAPSGWLLCYGQDISRSTYEVLFDTIGVTYGIGNGSTTFTLPDMRGRVVAGQDDMGGTSANRLTGQSGGLDGDTLGAVGGAETHQLATAELPSHSHTGSSLTISYGGGHTHAYYYTTGQIYSGGTVGNVVAGSGSSYSTGYAGDHSHSVSGSTGNTGSGNSHNNVQPTIILNYIIFAGA
jgi:microcystin-dependent protein